MKKISDEVRRTGQIGRVKLALLEALAPFSPTMRNRRDRRRVEMARWAEKCATVERFEGLLETLGPGDICLDLGANVGKITRLFAETGATVHAFEPDPWTFRQLTAAAEGFDNVIVHNTAVGAESAQVFLTRQSNFETAPERASTGATVGTKDDGIPVEQIDIVDFIEALGAPVRVVKMDVEGSEIAILNRLFGHAALERIEHLFVETHEFRPHLTAATASLRAAVPQRRWGSISLDWV